jgi:glucose-6-phosphate dehydrogenase assembly protein OpcA
VQLTAEMEPSLCATWDRILTVTADSPERASTLDQIESVLKCKQAAPQGRKN